MLLGIDESGRGPVIGDMVIAGVLLTSRRTQAVLAREGVKDSKELSRRKREALFPIIQRRALSVMVRIVTADDVDAWRGRGGSLNELEAKVFSEIINEAHPEEAIVDCSDVIPATFQARMTRYLGRSAPRPICEHFADKNYPVVSAASIVAKVVRDRRIRDLCDSFGELGSGYCSDRRTIAFLESWYDRTGTFPPFARKTWCTIGRIENERAQKRLPDYSFQR